jgi:hypothetical protein
MDFFDFFSRLSNGFFMEVRPWAGDTVERSFFFDKEIFRLFGQPIGKYLYVFQSSHSRIAG